MTGKKSHQTSNTDYAPVNQERVAEVFRIFSLMGIQALTSGEDHTQRIKEFSILKPHPYGIKVSDRSEG